ncbi:ligase-associated DNA damage response exonuclease [Pelomonas cellulosilytica]|uniref:Ligase-associated DNA damage response exonuclease n=1 Tax=Pelomonas cellulosilytica TaxID=2906762 RepID=A0ABS8Y1D9_9BURK|nr:ligase-associated DNA damage response exonuclease [Pelomonas sp. P8]MCE4556902.1 ligase-associated DNA damage response exonuclease [Pelomonas sp. P8]
MPDLVTRRPEGLYCEAGGFFIDPWLPVDKAVITHAHADHCRPGHGSYLAQRDALGLMRSRLGDDAALDGIGYGEPRRIGDVTLSLHPAGHVLGSAQVRIEHSGEVWVVAGDYFVSGAGDCNTTCAPFEPVRCDVFVTESTFGLPIYRWAPQNQVLDDMRAWWADCSAQGQHALLMGYSLGKAQRLVAGLATDDAPGPVLVHSAVARLNAAYGAAGVALPAVETVTADTNFKTMRGALVIAPPAVQDSRWAKALGPHSDAFASGWMRLRGARRRRSVDRGFVFSDHADWPGLLSAIRATGAQRVIVTHGDEGALVRYLAESGLQAEAFATEYGDEAHDVGAEA